MNVDYDLEWNNPVLFNSLNSLNITHASCYCHPGTGRVYLTMPGTGGVVDQHGLAVPGWIEEFLRDSARQDVLSKLQRSKAVERHAFLIVTFIGAPFAVESYLTGNIEHLPSRPPDLPEPVTGIWVVSGMGRKGIRWQEGIWKIFYACSEGIDG